MLHIRLFNADQSWKHISVEINSDNSEPQQNSTNMFHETLILH